MKDKLILTQSKIKHLEREESCPRFWYERYVNNASTGVWSEYMLQGLYFEAMCFGANAKDPIDKLILPSSVGKEDKDGNIKLTALGGRMMEQVNKFRGWFDPESPTFQGHVIEDVQVKVSGEVNGWKMEGTIDFITRKDGVKYLWDLKHTGDVDNDFGPFGWGDPANVDYLQQVLYQHLHNMQYSDDPAEMTYVLVMDSGTKMGHKRIPVEVSAKGLDDLFYRVNLFEQVVDMYEAEGLWPRVTTEDECKVCVVEDCPFKWHPNLGFRDTDTIFV